MANRQRLVYLKPMNTAGTIPETFRFLTALTILDLTDNGLSGESSAILPEARASQGSFHKRAGINETRHGFPHGACS